MFHFSRFNSDLSELKYNSFGAAINLTDGGYTESNPYVFPCDGYLQYGPKNVGQFYLMLQGATGTTLLGCGGYYPSGGNQGFRTPVPVRKGMKCWATNTNTNYTFTPME